MPKETPKVIVFTLSHTEATATKPIGILLKAKAKVLRTVDPMTVLDAIIKYGNRRLGLKGTKTVVDIEVVDETGKFYLESLGLKKILEDYTKRQEKVND